MTARARLLALLGDGSTDDALVQVRVGDLRAALGAASPEPDTPRWQDVVIPLVRSERARLEEHLAWARRYEVVSENARAFREREIARVEARIAPLDAALARLAEPEPREKFRAMVAEVGKLPTSVLAAPADWPPVCPHCRGDGAVSDTDCEHCNGSGVAPSEPTAAERWRAVPERAREAKLSELSDDVTIYSASPDCDTDGIPYADHAEASRALLALAREAEGGGV